MSDTTRDLLISLASHMAYMQGQLEARHELDDPEDYYWYRESVLLRQKVADHLAAEAQQPSSSLPELRSSPPTVMEAIELSEKAEAAGLGQVDFARAAELLQRQVLVPVSVSERLPGPEVCVPHPRTKRGNWCWGFERCEVSLARPARWRLMHMEAVEMEASHWLPAHALPLPEVGE
jgi:hypothetical protein